MTPRLQIAKIPLGRAARVKPVPPSDTMSRVPSRGTPQRTIRVADDLWRPFVELAESLGETPSQIVREAIRGYLGTHGGTWTRALQAAEERGEDLTEVVRDFLLDYINRP